MRRDCRERRWDSTGWSSFYRGGGVFDSHWDVFYLANHYPQFPMVRDYPPHWRGRSHSAMILPLDGEPTLVVDIPDWRRDQVVVADVRFSLSVPECVAHAVNERGLGEARLGLVGSNALLAGAYRALLKSPRRVVRSSRRLD